MLTAGVADVLHEAQVSVLVTTDGLVEVDAQLAQVLEVLTTTGLVDEDDEEEVDFQSSQAGVVVVVLTTGLVLVLVLDQSAH